MRIRYLLVLMAVSCRAFDAAPSGPTDDAGSRPPGTADGGTANGDGAAPQGPLQVVLAAADTKGGVPPDPPSFTHACALRTGVVRCWGNDQFGQATPAPGIDVAGESIVELAAGFDHTCARSSKGTVRCWGYNFHGQLGVPDNVGVVTPNPSARTGPVTDATQIAAGYGHTCALVKGGKVVCWGKRNDGEFGSDNSANGADPVELTPATVASSVAAGRKSTCLVEDGAAYCMGANAAGEGGAAPSPFVKVRTKVALDNVASVVTGKGHACAITKGASLHCWGSGTNFGGASSGPTPVPVGPAQTYVRVATDHHTCALRSDGVTIDCWGTNTNSRLGASAPGATKMEGIRLPDPSPIVSLAVGGDTSCAMTAAGALYCWGDVALFGVSPAIVKEPTLVP